MTVIFGGGEQWSRNVKAWILQKINHPHHRFELGVLELSLNICINMFSSSTPLHSLGSFFDIFCHLAVICEGEAWRCTKNLHLLPCK